MRLLATIVFLVRVRNSLPQVLRGNCSHLHAIPSSGCLNRQSHLQCSL
ncbi:Rieske 2Fe-2S domain-containing protein [Pseudarcicella hirudinis]